MPIYWLSFALPEPPAQCCIIEARNPEKAYRKALRLGLRVPGAEVLFIPIPPSEAEARMPRNRWLTPAELQEAGTMDLGDVLDQTTGN